MEIQPFLDLFFGLFVFVCYFVSFLKIDGDTFTYLIIYLIEISKKYYVHREEDLWRASSRSLISIGKVFLNKSIYSPYFALFVNYWLYNIASGTFNETSFSVALSSLYFR